MEKRLFVGNLPYEMGEGDLEAALGEHGQVVSASAPPQKFQAKPNESSKPDRSRVPAPAKSPPSSVSDQR